MVTSFFFLEQQVLIRATASALLTATPLLMERGHVSNPVQIMLCDVLFTHIKKRDSRVKYFPDIVG